ncbi:MAG: CMD domain protein [Chelatococcus sp.]|uniref:CMD domain protein n=1 Tax=unclassified Chelatococcus TaxID=2638111 RepID=UPI001BCF2EE8|nr:MULTISPECIES: CMD domain protein [unclassified Chelatococcus]CAH1653088.1 CMD domain protein [Hyphomicrobiales bacterium]MBS7740072.1 CMD domain protein [Chelatococcus sp. HY11]MBX3537784.1 CMD domain protein [Chelatococcus sp.]MBX3545099.1 CMD domain protein [Chelatococcus sp.]MCO5078627.1 CMD domain protein [Chelatococcus sp.]
MQTDIIQGLASIAAGSPLAEALKARAEIMRLSDASHDAVLLPKAPGGLSHAMRAALATRMALWLGDDALAAHYQTLLAKTGAAAGELAVTVAATEATPTQPRLAAIVRHIDLLTREPRAATRADIEALEAAGLDEADIVRLSELAAFVNYQARVIAGFRSLQGVM